ncbi:MAG TPA: TPM domain-containing protein [Candidatus Saccharimonadales bacterium]|nr:TPM domain-containing protein [Candidatus Saccharimonadales bacterium]
MLARATGWWLLLLWVGLAQAAEAPLPPSPAPSYFVQYTNVVSPQTAARINDVLRQFEQSTSSQILVAIFPRLPQNAALEDYTLRVATAWKPGLKKNDNGAVLFIFIGDRKMRIEVGYGLEGALPDSLAKRIIDEQIAPRFRNGDYDGGVLAGVQGILQATRGEYKGTGGTRGAGKNTGIGLLPLLFIIFFILLFVMGRRRGRVYGGRGAYWGGGFGGWGGGGGGWSGGSSGGGGFSGGGGSFGGGGASGSW